MARELSLRAVRGVHDILPAEAPAWQRVEATARRVCEAYGYREIRLPIFERTELFARGIGEVTDIVQKEMYTFEDRTGESLTLRPEATASLLRAYIEHGLHVQPKPVKLYTLPVGSLGELGARQLLREYGLTYADLKSLGGSASHVGYKVIVDGMKDGHGDLLIAVITPKHPSITEIATFSEVKFLPLDAERVKGLGRLGYTPETMPANTFKGQAQPVGTVGFPTVLITNKDLPEPIAYTVTKTVIENKDALVRGHAGLTAFEPKTAWQPEKVGLPLHPGAERAYREKGWMK